MLILLIRSHCKICPLATIPRVCTVGNCWHAMGKIYNGQNQHFAELISRVCTVGNCWKSANFTMGPNVFSYISKKHDITCHYSLSDLVGL